MKQQVIIYEYRHSEINPIRIAIADDHKMIRELLASNINAMPGFKVVLLAENGRLLLKGMEALNQLPDICIIDINMPVMNGYDAQTAIKAQWPEIKSIAISIYEDNECIARMLHNGACGFISKQSTAEVIQKALLAVYYEGCYYKQIPDKILRETITFPELTDKEKEYVTLTCNGHCDVEIARHMNVTVNSLQYYRIAVYGKLNVNNKAELILYVKRTGIVFMK